ncbi:MAG: hypothetical protein V3R82_07220 [Candidatus Hydrothermarchaeales archaeon]
MNAEASKDGEETVGVPVVLKKEDYELIERISIKLGIDPSTWINLARSSKLKGMIIEANDEDPGLTELGHLG